MPRDLDYHRVQDCLESVKGVKSVHGLTVWCLTLEKNALAVHLAAGKLKSNFILNPVYADYFFPPCLIQ